MVTVLEMPANLHRESGSMSVLEIPIFRCKGKSMAEPKLLQKPNANMQKSAGAVDFRSFFAGNFFWREIQDMNVKYFLLRNLFGAVKR